MGVECLLYGDLLPHLLHESGLGDDTDLRVVESIGTLKEDVHNAREEEPEDYQLLPLGKEGEDDAEEGEDC